MLSFYTNTFWDSYSIKAASYGYNKKICTRLAAVADSYLKHCNYLPLTQHTAQNVFRYVSVKGGDECFTLTQYKLLLIALKILFLEVGRLEWAIKFLWDEFLSFAQRTNNISLEHSDNTPASPVLFLHSFSSCRSANFIDAFERFPLYIDSYIRFLKLNTYASRTQSIYLAWLVCYLKFNNFANPKYLNGNSIKAFITHLVINKRLSSSTQSQALTALLIFYREIFFKDYAPELQNVRPKSSRPLPVILSKKEVSLLLSHITNPIFNLMAKLIYGAGLRLTECVSLEITDININKNEITISNSNRCRIVILPIALTDLVISQIQRSKLLYQSDIESLRHNKPATTKLYLFPSSILTKNTVTNNFQRLHIHIRGLQKAIKIAAQRSKVNKNINCHILRHSFAAHLLENNYDIRTVQNLLGHADISSTMIYQSATMELNRTIISPLDLLN